MNHVAQGRFIITVRRLFKVRGPTRLNFGPDLNGAVATVTCLLNGRLVHTETFEGKIGTLEEGASYVRPVQFGIPDQIHSLPPETLEFQGRCPGGIFEYDIRMEKPR